jgi:hypothetical protein
MPAIPRERSVNPTPVSSILSATTILICALVVAYKFVLTRRLNVNWDEFYYLSFVHEQVRHEFDLLLQGAFVHLFTWLPGVGDEMDQVVAGRHVMVFLLAVTAYMLWRLGRRWLAGFASYVPPLVYLISVPVVVHGGSFRSDSLLAPLLVATLLTVSSSLRAGPRLVLAGTLLAAAAAITIKVALFLPIVIVWLAFQYDSRRDELRVAPDAARAIFAAGAVAILALGALLALHWLSLPAQPSESIADFGARTARKTLLDTPWFARKDILLRYIDWQPLPWALMLVGWGLALLRRRWDLAALGLALLPVAVYRNAFPYFYVVMLAPLSILAGFAMQEATAFVSRHSRVAFADAVAVVLWAGLLYQGVLHLGKFGGDRQWHQRMLVAAVHEIFPTPVNYVDRCGMIASFRKVNPFMSTWGMETYRDRATPFMTDAIATHRAAFVLVNTRYLDPVRGVLALLPQDAEAIRRFYPQYWGPVHVAGGTAQLEGGEPARIDVPFPERYRIFAQGPLIVDGTLRRPGDIVEVRAQGVTVQHAGGVGSTAVALFLAAANLPPRGSLPGVALFDLL